MSCQLFLFEPLEVSRGYITALIVLYWYFTSAVSMNGPAAQESWMVISTITIHFLKLILQFILKAIGL